MSVLTPGGSGRTIGSGLAALLLMTIAAPAGAASWGGTSTGGYPGENAAFPNVTALLRLSSDRVTVRNAQFLMLCTDRSDGFQSVRAFRFGGPDVRARLHLNRFSLNFAAYSDGREGAGTISGRMRPNGRGTAAITMSAVGRESSTNRIVEDCEAEVTYSLHRR